MPTPHEAARRRHSVPQLSLGDTRLSTWEERDRAHVELINTRNDATIVEWWDDDVRQAVEDGFLKPGKMHQTAYDYAIHVGLIARPGPQPTMYHSPRGGAAKEGYDFRRGDDVKSVAGPHKGEVGVVLKDSDVWVPVRWHGGKTTTVSAGSLVLHSGPETPPLLPPESARENIEARDFTSPDDALPVAVEIFGATHYDYRGPKEALRVFSPTSDDDFAVDVLYFKKGRYHWPKTISKRVKSIPSGAIPVKTPKMSVTYGPGWESRECACEHGCGARENPVDDSIRVDEHGIPWLVVERDPKAQVRKLEVQSKVGTIKGAREVYDLLEPWALRQNKEHLCTVLLDIHSELRGVAVIHIGSRDRVAVDPQDVLKPAISEGAKGMILVHNHPTGRADHSSADASLTKEMKKACDAAGITFIDHVVMGTNEYYSFTDKKLTKVKKKG